MEIAATTRAPASPEYTPPADLSASGPDVRAGAVSEAAVPVCHLRLSGSAMHIGGANRVIWSLSRGLLGTHYEPILYFLLNSRYGSPGQTSESRRHEGVEYFESAGRRFVDPAQIAHLARLFRERGVRILHSHDPKASIHALILKRLMPSLRLVATSHGYINLTRKGRFYNWLDKRVLSAFDRVLVVSPTIRDQFPERTRRKVEVLPNALDLDYWQGSARRPRNPGEPFTVGFVGRISDEKGWREYVETAARVAAGEPAARFRVAGDGPHMADMRELASAQGLDGRIEFCGAVAEIRDFYGTLDALLAPSWTEGLPMAQLEAGAMEIPVVATDVGGVSQLIEHGKNGLLAQRGDIATLSGHLLALAERPVESLEMGRRARRVIREKFSMTSWVDGISAVYEAVTA